MPSYGGSNIFGLAVTMSVSDNPRAKQTNGYGGLDGVESLDQGDRGRFTTVSGRFVCDDAAALNDAEMTFRSWKDGRAHQLVDQYGNAWENVLLDSFEPEGMIQVFAGSGQFSRRYQARFEHLTSS